MCWPRNRRSTPRTPASCGSLARRFLSRGGWRRFPLLGLPVKGKRLARAQIPEPWRMETFPFDRQPKLDKKKILSLYDAFDFITKKQNIIWVGPTGSGKTSLATGFLIQAIERGLTGRFVTFPKLVAELFRSVA